jgi:hypothetical protein
MPFTPPATRNQSINALALAGSRYGKIDRTCPNCSPFCKSAVNRKRKVLRIWRHDEGFATFNCMRCGTKGHTRGDKRSTTPPSPESARRRAEAERREIEDQRRKQRLALATWREAVPIAGTLAERYLINRGIDIAELPDDMARVLRFHPRCPWESGTAPCMVALWTDAITAEPTGGIHRTALTPTGEKIDKLSYGPNKGGVIRLWPDEAVQQGLVIGEGIETVLGAATRFVHQGTLLRPAWAAGDAGHLKNFPILAGIEAITILVDNDGTGQRDAATLMRRWAEADREVVRLKTEGVKDFNDLAVQEFAS